MKIDLKSFLIGALSVVCVVLLTGAKDSHEGEVGRYVWGESYSFSDYRFSVVVDTKTGRLYNWGESLSGGASLYSFEDLIDRKE